MAKALFSKVKDAGERQSMISLLLFIVNATGVAPGFAFVPEANANALHKAESNLITIDKNTKGPDGATVKVSATAAGIEAAKVLTPVTDAAGASPEAAKVAFVLEDNIVCPPIKRGGLKKKEDIYPFDAMKIGQSFFIPATEAKPTPAKSLASTVASATQRYAVKVEGQTRTNKKGKVVPLYHNTRQFSVRAVTEKRIVDGKEVEVKGARVWRNADYVPPAPIAPIAPTA